MYFFLYHRPLARASQTATVQTSQSHLQSAPQSSSAKSSSFYSIPSPSEMSVPTFSSGPPFAVIIPAAPAQPTAKGGESIYRTIPNWLAEVEMNQTLFMQYIEQQCLVEGVGRLEGIVSPVAPIRITRLNSRHRRAHIR